MYTQEELYIWKERAQNGPYKSDGDVKGKNPGDFNRIVSNAENFIKNGDSYLSILGDDDGEIARKSGINIRDAAFLCLLGHTKYENKVKSELLNHLKFNPNLSGQNLDVNPYFDIADLISRLLMTFMYSEYLYSDAEKEMFKNWFLMKAKVFKTFNDDRIEDVLDRVTGVPTTHGTNRDELKTHWNGYTIYQANKRYTNRAAAAICMYALVGIKFKNQSLIDSAKRWCKEYIQYHIMPSGLPAEFFRSVQQPESPTKGYGYSCLTFSYITTISHFLSIEGDNELYEYTTSEGYGESSGGKKNLRIVMNVLCDLLYDKHFDPKTGKNEIFSTTPSMATKIDGRNRDKGLIFARPFWFVIPNLYYKDSKVDETIDMLFQENLEYASQGGTHPFGGAGNIFPGTLFMYAGVSIDREEPTEEDVLISSHNELNKAIQSAINTGTGKSIVRKGDYEVRVVKGIITIFQPNIEVT